MSKFTTILAGLTALAALSLFGCGGGGSNQTTVAGTTFTTVELTDPAPTASSFSAGVAINLSGLAVGFADGGTNLQAAKWTLVPGETAAAGALLAPLAGNTYSAAYGVNDAGIIVGESGATVTLPDDNTTAVYWPDGALFPSSLNTTGLFAGGSSAAYAINFNGEIVGEAAADADGNTVAVYWSSPAADPLTLDNLPGGSLGSAYAIGEDGSIVGEARDAGGLTRAVVWLPQEGGGYQPPFALAALTDQVTSVAFGIDASGRAVGEAELGSGAVQGVIWNADGSVAASLGDATSAQAVNAANRIAGYNAALSGEDRAALWNASQPTDTTSLEVAFSQAYGLNDSDQVVGVVGSQAIAIVPQ